MRNSSIYSLFILVFVIFAASATGAVAKHSKKTGNAGAGTQWLSGQQVAALLQPGAVWCFEPEGETCLFKAISNGAIASEAGNRFSYDMVELWDEATVLSVPTLGELGDEGFLCETIDIAFKGISITGRDGRPVSKMRFAEVKSELVEAWRPDEGREFCFGYIREYPDQPDLISQYLFVGGNPDGEPLSFFLSLDVPAVANFQLRY